MKLSAGSYYVGDLCYVLGDRWPELCQLTISGNSVLDGVFTMKDGTEFATFCTKWGDGVYADQFGNEYSVDAGLIGCVKWEDVTDSEIDRDNILALGNLVNFEEDFTVESWAGLIKIGHILIDTDPDEEDEDDEYNG